MCIDLHRSSAAHNSVGGNPDVFPVNNSFWLELRRVWLRVLGRCQNSNPSCPFRRIVCHIPHKNRPVSLWPRAVMHERFPRRTFDLRLVPTCCRTRSSHHSIAPSTRTHAPDHHLTTFDISYHHQRLTHHAQVASAWCHWCAAHTVMCHITASGRWPAALPLRPTASLECCC